jgi:hypothetical protein
MNKKLSSTVQGIGALLRNAGYPVSASTTSHIRGLPDHSYGFKIKKSELDFVGTRYVAKLHIQSSARYSRKREQDPMLAQIEKTLKDLGYNVDYGDQYTPNYGVETGRLGSNEYLWISVEGFQ